MHSEAKHLLKHSVFIFLSTFIGGLVLFAANILLAKRFGPKAFGDFKTVINLFCFLPALIELGVSATLVKYIAEFSDERINILVRRLLKFRMILCQLIITIMFAITSITKILMNSASHIRWPAKIVLYFTEFIYLFSCDRDKCGSSY